MSDVGVKILTKLLRNIAPVKTFFIKNDKVAFCEIKLSSRGMPINPTITPPIKIDDPHQARRDAISYGRLECQAIGILEGRGARIALYTIINNTALKTKYPEFIKIAKRAYEIHLMDLHYADPNPNAPDIFGWRVWHWDSTIRRLISPSRGTIWDGPSLLVPKWSTADVVRGYAGIHAARMPHDWLKASLKGTELNGYSICQFPVIGIVERFRRYVLGTEGWRAEEVMIKKLKAPTVAVGLTLEQIYPEVEVHYNAHR